MNPAPLFSRPDRIHDPLYVVTMVSNPVRFRSRWKLYEDFARHVEHAGAVLHTAEIAFGDRDFALTEPDNPRHLQLRTSHELWHKENALNLAIQRLPADWKYVAWIDADVSFARHDWADETLHALQHYAVVQMWSHAQDLGPNHELLSTHQSFAYCHTHQLPESPGNGCYSKKRNRIVNLYHPGYAWAARREAIDAVGGLLDHCILGSADNHMACALIGCVDESLQPGLSPRYALLLQQWQARAERHIQRNVGYVPGTVLHHWHGSKESRRYLDRWKILISTGFDPDLDLKRDRQGPWQLTDRSVELRDKLRAYFRQRDEDQGAVDPRWSETMEP